MTAFTTARTARVAHECDSCAAQVPPGTSYLSHVATPNHDGMGNPRWWRITECPECARRYGRGPLLTTHKAKPRPVASAEASSTR